MTEKQYKTFADFWPFYVREHANPTNRKLHFLGTTLALINLARFVATRNPRYLLYTPLSGYFFAWVGHFLVEKNKPATFTYPVESLMADFKMYGLMWTGKMDAEVEKALQEMVPPDEAMPHQDPVH